MWVFSRSRRRFEFRAPTGQITMVAPLEGGDLSDVPNAVRGTPPASLVEKAKRLLAGDAAAEDEITDELLTWNTAIQARTGASTTPASAGQAGQGAGGQPGAMLPSPEYLNAYVDVLSTAANIADATEKLKQREETILREARRLGLPVDLPSLYQSGAGETGRFPTTPAAISELAATNPQYLRAFGGMQNLAAATEINRRQNVLARVASELEQRTRDVDLNRNVHQLQRQIPRLKREHQQKRQAVLRASARSNGRMDVEGALQAVDDELNDAIADITEDIDLLIEQERPGWLAWRHQGVQKLIDQLSPQDRAAIGGGGNPGQWLSYDPERSGQLTEWMRARGYDLNAAHPPREPYYDPTEGVGTRYGQPGTGQQRTQLTNHEQARIFAGERPEDVLAARTAPTTPPALPAPSAPSPGQQTPSVKRPRPAEPPPPGMKWSQAPDGTWIMVPMEDEQAIPAFAEGGIFGGGGAVAQGRSSLNGGAIGGVTSGAIATPPTPEEQQPVDPTEQIAAQREAFDQEIRAKEQQLALAWRELQQSSRQQETALRQAHAQRMSQLQARRQAAIAENPFLQGFLAPPQVP
jgi:hypothetical protein